MRMRTCGLRASTALSHPNGRREAQKGGGRRAGERRLCATGPFGGEVYGREVLQGVGAHPFSSLLSFEREKGKISECLELVRITVTTLDGKTTTHTLDSEHHQVRDLKFLVEEKQCVEWHAQHFSYAPEGHLYG